MSRTFLLSDPHFNHSNIINLAKRPFADVFDMNHKMILWWNQEVKDEDTVIVPGDFAWAKPGEFFHQLRGKKILVKGNHDPKETLDLPWQSIHDTLFLSGTKEHPPIHIYHFPLEDWNHKFRGGIHFHGHTHGNLKTKIKGRLDISAENIGYKPVLLSALVARVKAEAALDV